MREIEVDLIDISRFPKYCELPAFRDLEEQITRAILEQLGLSADEVFDLTCGRIEIDTFSITGTKGLATKALKYRISGRLRVEAELVDDFTVDRETWEKLRLRHEWSLSFYPEVLSPYFSKQWEREVKSDGRGED